MVWQIHRDLANRLKYATNATNTQQIAVKLIAEQVVHTHRCLTVHFAEPKATLAAGRISRIVGLQRSTIVLGLSLSRQSVPSLRDPLLDPIHTAIRLLFVELHADLGFEQNDAGWLQGGLSLGRIVVLAAVNGKVRSAIIIIIKFSIQEVPGHLPA